jgi:hypothetical protein
MKLNAGTVCVYTIHHSDGLREACQIGGGTWTEAKTWRSALEVFNRSSNEGTWLPIFFAAADRSSGLLYVARLDKIGHRPEKCVEAVASN